MTTLYRSATMDYYQIIVARESAWEFLSELGNLNTLHLVEDNQESQINRPFTNYVKRCEELQKKIEMIKEELIKWNFKIEKTSNIEDLLNNFKLQIQSRQKAGQTYLDEVEQEIQYTYHRIQDQLKSYDSLQERGNTLIEYDQVLKISKIFFGNNFLNLKQNDQQNEDEYLGYQGTKVNYIMGTINCIDSDRFRRMIFRVSKGNAMINFKTIDIQDLSKSYKDPKTQILMQKDVFLILYPGGSMETLKFKLLRFCDSFNCQRFTIPENEQIFDKKINEIRLQYNETYELQQSTMYTLKESMRNLVEKRKNNCSYIEELSLYILREKSIYQCMNMLKI